MFVSWPYILTSPYGGAQLWHVGLLAVVQDDVVAGQVCGRECLDEKFCFVTAAVGRQEGLELGDSSETGCTVAMRWTRLVRTDWARLTCSAVMRGLPQGLFVKQRLAEDA